MTGSADKPGAVCAGRIAELRCPDMTKGGFSAATHRRHDQLVAAAGAAIDLVAIAEFQILAHADADFAQPRARR